MTSRHLEVLGVSPGASLEEARRAFRKLSLLYHPDKNKDPGAVERYRKVLSAYEAVKEDPRLLERPPVSSTLAGSDLSVVLRVRCSQIFFRDTATVSYRTSTSCGDCGGTGASDGDPRVCGLCGGSGRVSGGFLRELGAEGTCPECRGVGSLLKKYQRCKACQGTTVVPGRDKAAIKLDRSHTDGFVISVPGKGGCGRWNGPRGDLFVRVEVSDKASSSIRGKYLYVSCPTRPVDLILNYPTSIEIPPIGRVTESFQPGQDFKELDVQGHTIRLVPSVVWPTVVSAEARSLYERIRDLGEG